MAAAGGEGEGGEHSSSGQHHGPDEEDTASAAQKTHVRKRGARRGGNKRRGNKKKGAALETVAEEDEGHEGEGADGDADGDRASDTATIATVLIPPADDPHAPLFPRSRYYPRLARTWVPIVPDHEVRPVLTRLEAGLYTKRSACFATAAIPGGTRIISEPHLIFTRVADEQMSQLLVAFRALPAHEQARVWKLNPSPVGASPLLAQMADSVEPVMHRVVAILRKKKGERSAEEERELEEVGPKLQEALIMLRIAARWHGNRYCLTEPAEHEQVAAGDGTANREAEGEAAVAGLFVETAFLRHSCVPNCYAVFNHVTKRLTVHTLRTVLEGEELTLAAVDKVYYQHAELRQKTLHERFGIKCTCDACDSSGPKFDMHEQARRRCHVRLLWMTGFLTTLEKMKDGPELRSNELPFLNANQQLVLQAETMVLDLISDLIATSETAPSLSHPTTIFWYNVLLDRICPHILLFPGADPRMRWGFMAAHAIKVEKISRLCLGPDNEDWQECKRRRDHVLDSRVRMLELLERRIVDVA
ncbi:hypothetical protein ACN47E_006745 [Coniothyrium glycines]